MEILVNCNFALNTLTKFRYEEREGRGDTAEFRVGHSMMTYGHTAGIMDVCAPEFCPQSSLC